MNDLELKQAFIRLKSGDTDAFADIYHSLKHVVFTIVWPIVRVRETAEDVTQDVFVKLYVSPPDPSINNVRAWIFRMARNLAIDELRKKQSVGIEEHEVQAVDEADRLEWKWDVESALSALPDLERQIVTLHLNGDLPFAQIARIVELSIPATYRKYRKAIKALQSHFIGGEV